MLRVAESANDALNVAGSLCGVPFVGVAAVVVDRIVKTCREVKVHKQRTTQISLKCVQILSTLNDQAQTLEGSDLQQLLDQLMPTLEKILKRAEKWSNYNAVVTFLKNGDIKEGLDRSDAELDTAMQLFHINAAISLHSAQRIIADTMRSNTAELRDLLHQVLSRRSETEQIIELQSAGQHVAEQFMAAGQEELRHLRDLNTINANNVELPRTTSPVPDIQDSQRYLEYQRGLIHLHRETGIPPTIKVLNGEVTRTGDLAVAGGTYSDIWTGRWLGEEKVALKALRNIRASDPRARRRFENEINMWANLKNDHILPFYGIVTDLGQHIHIVSPWQENGNVLEYVKMHPDADRLPLIRGSAEGLAYLHSCKIIHGNNERLRCVIDVRLSVKADLSCTVKCANILVSTTGEARICDFGMSKIIEEVTEESASATLTAGGSARWMAPELIEGKSPSMEADTYSYAMAILELLTGKRPFADCKSTAAVIRHIVVLKQIPQRPETLTGTWLSDELWNLMCSCWAKEFTSRPSMAQVTDRLKAIECRK